MKKAIAEHDEVALAQVIDVARELGAEYPYRKELDQAEAILFDMLPIPNHQEEIFDKSEEEANLN